MVGQFHRWRAWEAKVAQILEAAPSLAQRPGDVHGAGVGIGGRRWGPGPVPWPGYAPAMDDTDRRLIALLRQDARMNLATLAQKLGVSRGTVANRLRRLEDEQVITGYTVRLRPDAEPSQIRAWMGVVVEGNQTREVVAHLLGEPGVAALHDTNGRWDLLAELRADSTTQLSKVLERVRLIKGIRSTETSILLDSYR